MAKQSRTVAKLQANARWLAKHKAWNWKWPGGDVLPRNCWPTGPTPSRKRHQRTGQGLYPDKGPAVAPVSKGPGSGGQRVYGPQPYCWPSHRRTRPAYLA